MTRARFKTNVHRTPCERQGANRRFGVARAPAASALPLTGFNRLCLNHLCLSRLCMILLLAFTIAATAGCSNGKVSETPEVTTGYGKSSGKDYSTSVNGTAVLKDLFRRAGGKVSTAHSITPKIDDFETIVWFRDRFDAPTTDAITRLEKWLRQGDSRQLIVVGRDHDSGISYWEKVASRAQGEELIKAKRRLAHVKSEFYSRRMTNGPGNSAECKWYKAKYGDYETATQLGGDWAARVNPSAADIHIGTTLNSKIGKSGLNFQSRRYQANQTPVLTANGRPLVTISWLDPNSYNRSNSIVLVSNASFLTNYGLVNQENRKLAKRLIERQSPGKTLFIESGTEPVAVLNSEQNHEPWAWIAQPPLKYIVPHFLLWGIFFCFVLYPIFGRPKRIEADVENTNFRTHVKALAKLLSRSGRRDLAQQKIDRYINRK